MVVVLVRTSQSAPRLLHTPSRAFHSMAIHGEGLSSSNVGHALKLENCGAGHEVHPNASQVGNETTGADDAALNRDNDVGEPTDSKTTFTCPVVTMPLTKARFVANW